MSECWYCHWGWPEPVAQIYLAAVAALGGDAAPLAVWSGPCRVE